MPGEDETCADAAEDGQQQEENQMQATAPGNARAGISIEAVSYTHLRAHET